MLGRDCQRARWRQAKPGADPGIFGRQPGGPVRRPGPEGGVRVDRADHAGAGVPEAGQEDARMAAALRGKEDRAADPSDAADRPAWAQRRSGRLPPPPFSSRFTRADVELLAKVDEAHETLSAPATKKTGARVSALPAEYQRLATISVAPIDNLRHIGITANAGWYRKTAPQVAIGERRRPDPQGRPGYLRVDTVHQGDQDGVRACITSMRSTRSHNGRW
jgi:hypothetical protein